SGMNAAWLDSTWGSTARADGHYDSVLVTDSEGTILFGESRGGSMGGVITDHFSGTDAVLAALGGAIEDTGDQARIGTYARAATGPAAIAASVIHGTARQLAITAAERRILWLAKRIDDTMLKQIAMRYHVPVPRMVEGHPRSGDEQSLDLRDQ